MNSNHDNEEHFIAIIGFKDSETVGVLKKFREIEVADATPERFSQKQISAKILEERNVIKFPIKDVTKNVSKCSAVNVTA